MTARPDNQCLCRSHSLDHEAQLGSQTGNGCHTLRGWGFRIRSSNGGRTVHAKTIKRTPCPEETESRVVCCTCPIQPNSTFISISLLTHSLLSFPSFCLYSNVRPNSIICTQLITIWSLSKTGLAYCLQTAVYHRHRNSEENTQRKRPNKPNNVNTSYLLLCYIYRTNVSPYKALTAAVHRSYVSANGVTIVTNIV